MPSLFSRKPISDLLAEADNPNALRRMLGAGDLIMLAIGAVIGAGIFGAIGSAAAGEVVNGVVVRSGAGPALVLSFLLLGFACALAGLCYAELAAMIPQAGSAYAYSYATLGEFVAWIIGWDLILEYAVGNVAVAISWSDYFKTLLAGMGMALPPWLATGYRTALLSNTPAVHGLMDSAPHIFGIPVLLNLPACGIVLAITWLLVLGVRESARANNIMVAVKLIALTLFIVVGLQHINPANYHPFAPNGFTGIHHGAAIVFFAYIGFDAISTAAEETKNPQRNLPIGILGGLAICTLIYIIVGFVLTGMVPYSTLGNTADPLSFGIACVALALIGRIAAHFVPPSPAPEPGLAINWNPFSETWRNLRLATADRAVFNSLLGISWLWFFGSIFLTSFTPFARQVLGGNEAVVTLLLAIFSIGIGLGAVACERLSGRKVEIGLVPFGSIGMTLFAVDLWLASRALAPTQVLDVAAFAREARNWRVMADLFLLAFFGGLYSVPLYALIQSRAPATHRARIIAANNILNALFMVVAALMAKGLLDAGLTFPQLFLVVGIMNAAVAAYVYLLVPEFLMRFLAWLLVHSIYRLEGRGLENIPDHGPAVLVCNHVSFVDPLVILASSPRPIRFVMDYRIFHTPGLAFFFRTGKAIPIAPAKENAPLLEEAYEEIARALGRDELVAIFPEGRITDTGELYRFRNGIQRVLERTPVPVIPLALKGLWGSYFSRRHGRAMGNPLHMRPLLRICLEAGPPMAPRDATPQALEDVVRKMRGNWK